MLRKCCDWDETKWNYWIHWKFLPLKNAKNQIETREIEAFDELEVGPQESHSRGSKSETLLRAYKSRLNFARSVDVFGRCGYN